jgi:AcrR family transcriptional regulator
MARPKRQSDESLLDAAMPALFAKGPGEFTLAEVGRAVGLSPATLVQRFGSKQGLVLAALELTNRRNIEALEGLSSDRGAAAVIRIFVDRTPGPKHEHLVSDQLLWLRESMSDPHVNALTKDYFAKFRKAVADRMPPLPISPADAAMLVEAQWHGSLLQWGIGRDGRLREFVEHNLRIRFATIGATSNA